jgi:ABC-2 type transport system permease protein
MRGDIARLDLRLRRRSIAWYTVGLGAYAFLIVALYPAFKDDTSLDALTQGNATLSALFGATGSLTSPDGWLNANVYANFLPLFVLLGTIGYGAEACAGQDESDLLGLVVTLPLRRREILLQKMTALLVLALPVALVTMACVFVGRAFELSLDVTGVVGVTVGVVLLGLDFGLLALAVGAASGSRGRALGVAGGIAAASYVLSSLASVVDWIRPWRYVSPFYYSVGNRQLVDGLSVSSLAVLLGVAVVLGVWATVAFQRLDVH